MKLSELLSYWQKELRLQDWLIQATIERRHDMHLEDSEGTCHWDLKKKLAVIEIMDPIDYTSPWPQNIEVCLVHELLHLHFAPFATDAEPTNTQHEQAIELIARALVTIRNGKNNNGHQAIQAEQEQRHPAP